MKGSNIYFIFIAWVIVCFIACNILAIMRDFSNQFFDKVIYISQGKEEWSKRAGYYMFLQTMRVIIGLFMGFFYFKVCQIVSMFIISKTNPETITSVISYTTFFNYLVGVSWAVLIIYVVQNIRNDCMFMFWMVAGYFLSYMYFTM